MSAAKTDSNAESKTDYRIKGGLWASAWMIAAVIGVLGLAAGYFGGGAGDVRRFAYSYLFGFAFVFTLAMGALFFVFVQHLTSAFWSVSVRRIAEFFMAGIPVLALLFVPVLMMSNHTHPWVHGAEHGATAAEHPIAAGEHGGAATEHAAATGHGAREHGAEAGEGHAARTGLIPGSELWEQIEHQNHRTTMHGKAPYLNGTFYYIRLALYFAVWILLAMRFFGWSTAQDKSKDHALTVKAQNLAPIATGLFALSVTFASFDWFMSLNPMWYSTIFGVWIFAGSAVIIHALVTLVALSLRSSGLTGNAIHIEHFHDLGKLTFGFLVFWAYISFSQFFLTWYASIPEETVFYHWRWGDGPWKTVSLSLLAIHFVLPFAMLLSRNMKRRYVGGLAVGSVIILCMHAVEMYWLVMPNYQPATSGAEHLDLFSPSWIDAACLIGCTGIYFALVFFHMTRHPLIPVGDPRLARSLHHENA